MLPSTPRRRTRSPRRALAYVLAALLVPLALLVSDAPASSAGAAGDPAHIASVSSSPGGGNAAGGSLLPREHGVVLAADQVGPGDAPTTTALPASVRVTSATSFYDVEGADIRSLVSSLRQRGPSDGRGTWAASTSWVFRWSYQPILGTACQVQAAQVGLELSYLYPRWNTSDAAAPTIGTAWQGYLDRVELHEHGHRDIAEAAAAELAHALEALPGQASCEALAESARATAAELLARHAQAQIGYDRETGHGATQGAVLGQ